MIQNLDGKIIKVMPHNNEYAAWKKKLTVAEFNAIADENTKSGNNMLLADTLKNILHTKISPELLPTENGVLVQKTEDILGNYEIHDFVLLF